MNKRPSSSKPNYTEMFKDFTKAQGLTKTCRKKLELHLASKSIKETLSKVKRNMFASPVLSPTLNTSPKALSVSTVASDSEKSKFSFKPKKQVNSEIELLQKITKIGPKMKNVVETLLEFEEVLTAEKLLNKFKLTRFRRMSRGLLGLVVQSYEEFKKQQAANLGLSILYHAAQKIEISDSEFSFQASKVLKKSVKVRNIRKSKCYGLIKNLKFVS